MGWNRFILIFAFGLQFLHCLCLTLSFFLSFWLNANYESPKSRQWELMKRNKDDSQVEKNLIILAQSSLKRLCGNYAQNLYQINQALIIYSCIRILFTLILTTLWNSQLTSVCCQGLNFQPYHNWNIEDSMGNNFSSVRSIKFLNHLNELNLKLKSCYFPDIWIPDWNWEYCPLVQSEGWFIWQ